jgi:hypothetical protein
MMIRLMMIMLLSTTAMAGFQCGVNQAWVSYGNDFGNNGWQRVGASLSQTFQSLRNSSRSPGKLAVRQWLHCGAETTPVFHNGVVVATDSADTMFDDLARYFDEAKKWRCGVWLCLFNGAVPMSAELRDMIVSVDEWRERQQSYFAVVLEPLLRRFAACDAFVGVDVINEPEGSLLVVDGVGDNAKDRCQSTASLLGSGAGWAHQNISVGDMQRFVAGVAGVVRRVAGDRVQVTLGSWSMRALTDAFGATNYWSDACLAPFDANGTLSVFTAHTYAHDFEFDALSPFRHVAADYELGKPLIVGEFSAFQTKMTSAQQYAYLADAANGYDGALAWQVAGGHASDSLDELRQGIAQCPP